MIQMFKTDIARATEVAETITSDFYNDGFKLSIKKGAPTSKWSEMPEVKAVKCLRDSGASECEVRRFLTFIAAMDRARDSIRLWKKGLELFQSDPDLFDPAKVADMHCDALREKLCKSEVSQRHEPDSKAWKAIACSLADKENPVSRVVNDEKGDAIELLLNLGAKSEGKPRFPLLRGPKIGPMWMRMLVDPGKAEIENIDIIPVAVDVHVKRVTTNLGVLDASDVDESLESARSAIQYVWRKAVEDTKIEVTDKLVGSAALDPALWAFGKYGCSHCESQKENKWLPISSACDHCRFRPRAERPESEHQSGQSDDA